MKPLQFFLALSISLLTACTAEDDTEKEVGEEVLSIPDWGTMSHSNAADPDYAIVFPQSKVNELDIIMTADDWSAIRADMTAKIGYDFGARPNNPGSPPGFSRQETEYVAVSLKFEGKEWYKVGFRLKGNSTLSRAWSGGIYKLPFRLKMDEYEDQYPQIDDQRFYGFKELSMSPSVNDNSLMREKMAADLFRAAGVPAAQTAFYKVYIDFGAGRQYCGIYTMVEVIDDSMVETQFGEDNGNIYKPESNLKTFTAALFEKKNNEEENNYSDVQNLITALHAPTRTTDAALWRSNLEQTFNVSHFIKYLAANTTMVNWDAYGEMAHNYYLYNHPQNKLTWIPWDHNEALQIRNNRTTMTDVSLTGVSIDWPLIRYILDDPTYLAQYKASLKTFHGEVFTVENTNSMIDRYYGLISPFVVGPEATEQGKYTYLANAVTFTNGPAELKQHIAARRDAVAAFVK